MSIAWRVWVERSRRAWREGVLGIVVVVVLVAVFVGGVGVKREDLALVLMLMLRRGMMDGGVFLGAACRRSCWGKGNVWLDLGIFLSLWVDGMR